MFVLGHIGIGRELARPWRRSLPAVAFIAGTLVPDIIDKTLYYTHVIGQVPATRTIGHTGLLLGAVVIAAALSRSRLLAAVAAGMLTHLALDCLLDFTGDRIWGAWKAAFWPLLGPFPPVSIPSVTAHLARIATWPVAVGEIVGGACLAADLWRARRASATRQAR